MSEFEIDENPIEEVRAWIKEALTIARSKIQAADDGEAAIVRSYWRGRESALLELWVKLK